MTESHVNLVPPRPIALKPRRVWTGLFVPGKKMIKLLTDDGPAIYRGQTVIDLYQDLPRKALIAVAIACAQLSRDHAEPSLNTLGSEPGDLFGGVFKDMKNVLRFRFRANGLTDLPGTIQDRLVEFIQEGRLPKALDPESYDAENFDKAAHFTATR